MSRTPEREGYRPRGAKKRRPALWPAFGAALLILGSAVVLGAAAAPQAKRPNIATTIKCDKTGEDAVKPGEVLTYTLTTVNDGTAPARDVAIINPVPANTLCIPKSAKGKGTRILFSIDGGKAYGAWPIRVTDQATGKQKDASPDQITHVKWELPKPLAPGKNVVVSFQVRVK